MEEKRCYTVQEVADLLQISPSCVYRLMKKQAFYWVKIGRVYRISKKSFDEWLEKTMKP